MLTFFYLCSNIIKYKYLLIIYHPMRKHLKKAHVALKKPATANHYWLFAIVASVLVATIFGAVAGADASLIDIAAATTAGNPAL